MISGVRGLASFAKVVHFSGWALGVYLHAQKMGVADEFLEGVRSLPGFLRDLVLLAIPRGGR
jgi:hypothetical protein